MIFDTKRKAEAKAPAHLTTNTHYIMMIRKENVCLHVAAIQNFLATLWIACESLDKVESILNIYHSA